MLQHEDWILMMFSLSFRFVEIITNNLNVYSLEIFFITGVDFPSFFSVNHHVMLKTIFTDLGGQEEQVVPIFFFNLLINDQSIWWF